MDNPCPLQACCLLPLRGKQLLFQQLLLFLVRAPELVLQLAVSLLRQIFHWEMLNRRFTCVKLVKLFFSYSPPPGIHPPPPSNPPQGVDFESFFCRFRVNLESILSRDSKGLKAALPGRAGRWWWGMNTGGWAVSWKTISLKLEAFLGTEFGEGNRTKQKSVKRSDWITARHSKNKGLGKEFYRKGNSVKRIWPFGESLDFRIEIFCAHPLPKSPLQICPFWAFIPQFCSISRVKIGSFPFKA